MYATLLLLSIVGLSTGKVTVETLPEAPLIEKHRSHLSLQCDFKITNESTVAVTLSELVLRELDSESTLMRRRSVNQGGTAPSIQTVINGPIPAGGVTYLFNPFHSFELDGEPAHLEFVFTFRTTQAVWNETVSFNATIYETKTELRLPIDGRLMVKDGHDFLSHHRRLGMNHPAVQTMGLTVNSSRFALDFVVLGPDNAETRMPPTSTVDWFGWGAPILAAGKGRVVAIENGFPDNLVGAGGRVVQNPRITPRDLNTLAGNYVAIDHGNGEFSIAGHLQEGSVSVEVGQLVEAGDPIGSMGLSGSTTHVHLHWQLQSSAELADGIGLPSAIARYGLHRGSSGQVVEGAPVDTGDIIEHIFEND